MSNRMVELLERQIELFEEQNELVRENSQLLGDMLNSLEMIANRPTVINNSASEIVSVKPLLTEQKGPVPSPDAEALMLAFYGAAGPDEKDIEVPSFDVFWPKKDARGWVRVSIKHPSKDSLSERVRRGCMCGKQIILKEVNGESFHTCEAVAQKGSSCSYRPAVNYDACTFLTNLPPTK